MGVQDAATSSSSTPRTSAQLSVYPPPAATPILDLPSHGTARGQHDDAAHVDLAVHPSRFVHPAVSTHKRLLIVPRCADDDDDLDEENIPGFSHPAISPTTPAGHPDKGKGRATEQLATPTGNYAGVSGNIGSAPSGAPPPSRRMVAGVQVETRYAPRCSDDFVRLTGIA